MYARIPSVNLKQQYESIRDEIGSAIRQVLERQAFILGPEVNELEQLLAQKHTCSYAIACASGSDALLLSLLALEIGRGDAVIVPSFTFFATGGSVARAGATPVFVDIDPRSFNINPQSVEDALRSRTNNGRIKAIMPVHLYGQCAEMEPILELAQKQDISVVEDAAQAILARYQDRAAGSMGICGCFSFFPTKNLGGFGDGGMVITNNADLAQRLRILRVHGAVKKYIHATLGINSRLDTLQAAILLVKLRHLNEWTALKQMKASLYRTAFLEAGLSDPQATYPNQQYPIVLPQVGPDCEHVYHQFTVRALRRDELSQHLAAREIEAAVYYPVPLHQQQAFAYLGAQIRKCPESERASREVLSLPIFPEITEQQQYRVVEEIRKFY